MRQHTRRLCEGLLALLSCALAACTGGVGSNSAQLPASPVASYPVTGTVSGLGGAAGLVLQNNGEDTLTVNSDGTLTFPASVAEGTPFNISVLSQPIGPDGSPMLCTVSNGSGTVSGGPIQVSISCVRKMDPDVESIGGSIGGLEGTGLVLQNSNGTQLSVTGNGPFTLATGVPPGTPYAITVYSQPINPDQLCTVVNGSGTTDRTDVTGIVVNCQRRQVPSYTVSVTVSGLTGSGGSLTLQNNGRDPLTISADGTYTFPLAIPSGNPYGVSAPAVAGTQSITCALLNATGVMGTSNVTNVQVSCQVNGGGGPPPARYTLGGTVTGLTGTEATLTLASGVDTLTLTADGPFTFPTSLLDGSAYVVTASATGGVLCTVANGSGTLNGANVNTINVSCMPPAVTTYTVGGTVSGLPQDGSIQVLLGDLQTLTVTNGSFNFSSPLTTGSSYTVTTQGAEQLGYTCQVGNGSGTIAAANVTNVAVNCTAIAAYIPVSSLVNGEGGQDGVLVIPSDKAAPTPTFVDNRRPYLYLGSSATATLANGQIVASRPQSVFYAAVGQDQALHIYAIDVGNATIAPTVRQVGAFAVTGGVFCGQGAQTDLKDPQTYVLVVKDGTESGCDTTGVAYVVRSTDSPTTAPTQVTAHGTSFEPVYNADGSLGGLVQGSSGAYFYKDFSFTNAQSIDANAGSMQLLSDRPAGTVGSYLGSIFVEMVSGDFTYAWRVSPAGEAVQLYQLNEYAQQVTRDGNGAYFVDLRSQAENFTQRLMQAPLTGSQAIRLFDASGDTSLAIVGANDTSLFFLTSVNDSSTVYSVPEGAASSTATPVATYSENIEFIDDVFLAFPPGKRGQAVLLSTVEHYDSQQDSITYASEARTVAGGLLDHQDNSRWLADGRGLGSFSRALVSDHALQVRGIIATDSTLQGGTVLSYQLAQGSFSTPFISGEGGAFTFSQSTSLANFEPWGRMNLATLFTADGSAEVLVFDPDAGRVIPISVPNSYVITLDLTNRLD